MQHRRNSAASICLIIGLASAPLVSAGGLFGIFGGKDAIPAGYGQKKPGQVAAIEKPILVDAAKPCANYAWGAGLESILRSRDVAVSHEDVIFRLYGGKLCISQVADFETLAVKVSHSYVLDNGRHVRINAEFISGAPTAADPLIISLREQHPVLFVWNGRPLLLVGMTYDEYVGPNQTKLFVVQKLDLLDPAAPPSKQAVTFLRDRDDPAQLDGWMQVDVRDEQPGEIPKEPALR